MEEMYTKYNAMETNHITKQNQQIHSVFIETLMIILWVVILSNSGSTCGWNPEFWCSWI